MSSAHDALERCSVAKKFKTFEEFLEYHGGDFEKAARATYATVNSREEDNAELRDQISVAKDDRRKLQAEVDALKAEKPAEGSIIVTSADKADLEAYRALGKPDAIKAEIVTLKSGAERLSITQALAEAGIPKGNFELASLLLESKRDVYSKEEEKDGEKVKTWDFEKLKKAQPSLFVAAQTEDEGGEENETLPLAKTGRVSSVKVIASSSKGESKASLGDFSKSYMASKYRGPQ